MCFALLGFTEYRADRTYPLNLLGGSLFPRFRREPGGPYHREEARARLAFVRSSVQTHAKPMKNSDRGSVREICGGAHSLEAQHVERAIARCSGTLCGQTLAPAVGK